MSEQTGVGFIRQVDLNFRECRIRAAESPTADLLFFGKYDPKILKDLKESFRMGDQVRFTVWDGVLVDIKTIKRPE